MMRRMKKAHKRIVIVVYMIISILGLCILIARSQKHILEIEKINALENPIDIADKYMHPKYDFFWRGIEGIDVAGQHTEWLESNTEYIYELFIWENNTEKEESYHYTIWESAKDGIGCETIVGTPGISLSSKYFYHGNSIDLISGVIDVFDKENACWKEEYFYIFYKEGNYEPYIYENGDFAKADVKDIEHKTELTIDEMVEIAKTNQDRLETILYRMRARMKAVEIIKLILETLLIVVVWIVIIYKCEKSRRKIQETENVKDGKG